MTVSAIFEFLANATAIWRRRSENKNAPDVKAAAKAQQEVNQQAKETKAVAEKDVEAVRKGLSE